MKTIHRLIVMMVAVVALAVFSAPVQASKTDSRIESSAKNSYVFKTYLQSDDIKVQSKDGVVTLTGTVAEESHKSLAEKIAASLSGVKSVNNRLKGKGELPAKNTDAWVTTYVKTMLLFHRNMNGLDTAINVKDGIVTLQGKAISQAQLDLTTEYVKDVKGVKDVKNEMTVVKTTKKTQSVDEMIDDASITAQVKMTLLYHESTSNIKTTVTTEKGWVTLKGKVGNAYEKDLAAKLASDVKGVKGVKNQIMIEDKTRRPMHRPLGNQGPLMPELVPVPKADNPTQTEQRKMRTN